MRKGFGAELTRNIASKLQAHFTVPREMPLEIKLRLERLALVELVRAMADEQATARRKATEGPEFVAPRVGSKRTS